MTALLKAALTGANVRRFGSNTEAALTGDLEDLSPGPLQAALDSLQRAEDRIAELETACLDARREGEEDGFTRGLAKLDAERTEQLEILQTAIDSAQATFIESLSSMDRLAASIARSCLETIIGDPAHYSDLVTRSLGRQLELLESSSVIQVSVSPDDFSDTPALEKLAMSSGARIVADSALAGGECRVSLRLGSIDIGPTTQWGRLWRTLSELAGPGA